MKLRELRKGFTLIELLVVVAIIALLILIAIQLLLKNLDKANDARRKSDLQRIATAFEDYYSDKECYPIGSILNNCGGSELKSWGLDTIPCDPVYHTPYCYVTDADAPSCFQKYRLLNTLKYLSDPIIKLLGCDSGAYCGWETECGSTGNSGFNYGVSSTNTTVLNPNILNPSSPPPLPTPAGGPWGCTHADIHGHSDCNNFGVHNPQCTYEFPDSTCGGWLYCAYSEYQCAQFPP